MSMHAHDHDHGHDHSHEGDGFVFGHEILGILADRGGRLPVAELKSAARAAFGEEAVYGNCHGDRFDFEGLLAFLSAAGKLSLDGEHASLGRVPGCSGH
jgi:probable metal-binding protein